ncbi:hypothetical protein VSR82_39870, partial [Burkholderia sp. JPY481]
SSFIARLHVANSVHARLACGSADKGYGCITPDLWKAKNRGKLIQKKNQQRTVGGAGTVDSGIYAVTERRPSAHS